MTQREQVKLELMMEQLLEMKQDVSELKERILDPNDGVVVKANQAKWWINENSHLVKEIPQLIQFKKTALRIIWMLVAAVIALGAKLIM